MHRDSRAKDAAGGHSLSSPTPEAGPTEMLPGAPARQRRGRYNLPSQPERLIGREPLQRQVFDLLRPGQVRLLTLTGAAGCGKTRLALEVAAQLRDSFQHGAFLIDLTPIRDSELVASAIARPLGVRDLGRRQ